MAEQQFPPGVFDGWTSFLTGTTLIDTAAGPGKSIRAVDIGGDWVDIGNAGTEVNIGPGDLLVTNNSSSTSQVLRVHSGQLNVDMTQDDHIGQDTWLIQTDDGTPTQGGFRVMNTGIVRIVGGTAKLRSSIIISGASADIQWRDCVLEMNATGSQDDQIRNESTIAEFRNWTLYKGYFTMIRIPAVNEGYKPRNCAVALGFSGSTPDINVPVLSYNTNLSNILDMSMWSGGQCVLIDPVNGHLMVVGPNSPNHALSYGIQRVLRRGVFSAVTAAGSTIAGLYAVKLRDSDSGRRKPAYTQERFGAAPYNIDRDLAYVFGAEEGLVLASATLAQTTGPTANEGNFSPDYRFDGAAGFPFVVADLALSQAALASMAFSMWGVSFTAGVATLPIAGDGNAADVSTTLFTDPLWAGSPEAGPHDTAVKVYDYWHWWTANQLDAAAADIPRITNDSAGWDVVPAPGATAQAIITLLENLGGVGSFPTVRAGDTILAQLNPVILDPAGPTNWDGVNVTIETTSWADGITTTGGVTARDGVNMDGASITGDLLIESAPGSLTGLDVTGVLTLAQAGTWTLDGSTIGDIANTSGGPITVLLLGGSTVGATTGPDVTVRVSASVQLTGGGVWSKKIIRSDTGAVILPWATDASSIVAFVPQSTPLRLYAYRRGDNPRVINFNSGLSGVAQTVDLSANLFVDPDLDVSAFLADITFGIELGPDGLIFFAEHDPPADQLPSIPQGQTLIHRFQDTEPYADAALDADNGDLTIISSGNTIAVPLPLFELRVPETISPSLTVEYKLFFDTADALLINPTFVVNPKAGATSKQVVVSLLSIDFPTAAQNAAAVWDEILPNRHDITGSAGALAQAIVALIRADETLINGVLTWTDETTAQTLMTKNYTVDVAKQEMTAT